MPLNRLSTGFFCRFDALSAVATSLSFGGRLRRTALPEWYRPAGEPRVLPTKAIDLISSRAGCDRFC
jgi:hypothetical protein